MLSVIYPHGKCVEARPPEEKGFPFSHKRVALTLAYISLPEIKFVTIGRIIWCEKLAKKLMLAYRELSDVDHERQTLNTSRNIHWNTFRTLANIYANHIICEETKNRLLARRLHAYFIGDQELDFHG